ALDHALARGRRYLAVASLDWETIARAGAGAAPPAFLGEVLENTRCAREDGPEAAGTGPVETFLAAPASERTGVLERYLARGGRAPERAVETEAALPAAPAAARQSRSRPTGPRVPGPVFVLSSPRSGSTLLRVMLAGHRDLFSPPELHLLPYDDLRAWHEGLAGSV